MPISRRSAGMQCAPSWSSAVDQKAFQPDHRAQIRHKREPLAVASAVRCRQRSGWPATPIDQIEPDLFDRRMYGVQIPGRLARYCINNSIHSSASFNKLHEVLTSVALIVFPDLCEDRKIHRTSDVEPKALAIWVTPPINRSIAGLDVVDNIDNKAQFI
jgi:hypothetical protein